MMVFDFMAWLAEVNVLLARSHELQIETRVRFADLELYSCRLRACLERSEVAMKRAQLLCEHNWHRTPRIFYLENRPQVEEANVF